MKRILRGKFIRLKLAIKKILLLLGYELVVSPKSFRLRKLHFDRPSIQLLKERCDKNPIQGLVVAEIGAYQGVNAEKMLAKLPIKKLYAIDPWDVWDSGNKNDRLEMSDLKQAERLTRKRLSRFKSRVIIIKKSSSDAVKDIKEELDFVYLDGDHTYEQVKKDLQDYYKLLKSGATFAGHDINNGASKGSGNGVTKAVTEFIVKNKLDLFIDKEDWWFKKK